ncbi:DDE superfamily endonuclease [Phytophthora infestans]|uniref:DDE superfamily endonuclease n=1 Tax=Phytophthora infestans TaxID=4787 RepID=A0A833T3E1_PHYIN|nr:DDE superfamily endonuclease [Phytophthora infestans]
MRRDDFALKTNHCVAFVKEEYSSWASDYLLTRQEDSLRRAIRRVALSRGFSFLRATETIISTQELLAEQQRFSAEVGAEIKKAYQRECVFNADETAVYYEEDPGIILAERGQSKSARVKGRRRSDRASVLLTVSAAGKKLKPLVIFRGQPGGTIERDMTAYSNQVLVTVQQNGWMDTKVWNETFINGQWAEFVCDEFPDPLAIYVDNLKCHVSETAQEAFASWGQSSCLYQKHYCCTTTSGRGHHGPVQEEATLADAILQLNLHPEEWVPASAGEAAGAQAHVCR